MALRLDPSPWIYDGVRVSSRHLYKIAASDTDYDFRNSGDAGWVDDNVLFDPRAGYAQDREDYE